MHHLLCVKVIITSWNHHKFGIKGDKRENDLILNERMAESNQTNTLPQRLAFEKASFLDTRFNQQKY
jgi:hypothetical protein